VHDTGHWFPREVRFRTGPPALRGRASAHTPLPRLLSLSPSD
jgi:hypothetical protein